MRTVEAQENAMKTRAKGIWIAERLQNRSMAESAAP